MAIEEVVAIPADSAVLEYSTDDVTYYELQDVSDITTSQGGLNEVERKPSRTDPARCPGRGRSEPYDSHPELPAAPCGMG